MRGGAWWRHRAPPLTVPGGKLISALDSVSGVTPRSLFKTFALAEVVTWALLITAMIVRGVGATDALVPIAGGVHGFVFLTYCVVTVIVWIDGRWRAGRGILGLALSIIPFATWPFEVLTDRAGLLSRTWRLGRGGEEPGNVLERLLAWVLRHIALAAVILAALVVVVFLVLLRLGPPVG